MKPSVRIIFSVSFMALLMAGCKNANQLEQDGWSVTADPLTSTLSITKNGLSTIVDTVQLNLEKENELIPLTGWNVRQDGGILVIDTDSPEQTSWEFIVSGSSLDVVCSVENAVLTGYAPAGDTRIPARVASQDNGIMYTQMGFVSAANIHHLFDRPTDIMIRFSDESRLSRNPEDSHLMEIQVPVGRGDELSVIGEYYTEVIGLAKYQVTDFKPVYKPIPERFDRAPTGWSSWYCYYMAPEEEDLVAETDALAEKLKPYGLDYVQLDAAFTRGAEANWLEWNKEMYPRGGKWWFGYIREKGLKPGLWVNIYGDNYENPSMGDKYPENYYLRDADGNLSGACCTADTTVVRLDYTNPEVIEKHLVPLFETLVNDWGLEYLKDAGWGRWMDYYEENRERAFNPEMDSREAYRNAQAALREVLGDDNYILGCAMHEVGVGFGFYDGSRTGGDDYASWTGEGFRFDGMQVFFRSLFGANYLNGICWWSDPDDVMIRDPLNMEEGKTIASTISLSGQAYVISDFIAEFSRERLQDFLHGEQRTGWAQQYPDLVRALPDEKLELYRKTMPALPIRAMDLYPFRVEPAVRPHPDEYPRALDLKVNAVTGVYDVVALYNWGDEKSVKSIDLHDDLGLEEETPYLVFDFWDRELLGKYSSTIEREIPPHGTSALIIRKVSGEPQLLATSRHLTCAFSIKAMSWDAEGKTLSGISETVPGDTYTLYLHVPEGYAPGQTTINALDVTLAEHPGGLLQISFAGQEEPVQWELRFQ